MGEEVLEEHWDFEDVIGQGQFARWDRARRDGQLNVRSSIAVALLDLLLSAEHEGVEGISMARAEWAAILSCSLRTVTKCVRDLQERGLVERGSNTSALTLRSGPKLQDVAAAVRATPRERHRPTAREERLNEAARISLRRRAIKLAGQR